MFDLFNNKIQELAKSNQGELKETDISLSKYCSTNSLCGDKVCWHRLNDNKFAYEVKGCMLCEASCELLWQFLQDKQEFVEVCKQLQELQTSEIQDIIKQNNKWRVFRPVIPYPMRYSCITLAFNTIGDLIE